MVVDTVRVSEKAKAQLIVIKKRTGIQNWNTICRVAFIISICEDSVLPFENITTDSSIEMTWKVFAGDSGELIEGLLKQRMIKESLDISDSKLVQEYFKLHIHRGISYITSVKSLLDLLKQVNQPISLSNG